MPHRTQRAESDPAVVVIGGGIAGLCAARELMNRGLRVLLLERSDAFGGCVTTHELAGFTLDAGAESFSTRSDTVPGLARELGLGELIVAPNPVGAWIQLPGTDPLHQALPLPATGILGIPADVRDPDIVKAIGRAGAVRASLDRVLPLGGLVKQKNLSLGEVVRHRMGVDVLTRLVAPVVSGVFSADPDDLDVDSVAPGLRAAMKQHGSLGAAVGALRNAAPAGSTVGGLSGGMGQLTTALVASLREGGAELAAGETVLTLARGIATGWDITTASRHLHARGLVVATDGPAAVDLLGRTLPALADERPAVVPGVALVTLVVDLPELDAHPRGTGVLVAAGAQGVTAKALTHATAKWDWLADQAGPGSHVLRLSYGRAGEAGGWTDEELHRLALTDVSVLLGTPVSDSDVVDWDVVRWRNALPHASVGHRDRVARIRAATGEQSLEVTGAWLAGTGLVSVIDDARRRGAALADRLV
ncbi:protoporphyrinogen oxidase [Arthrobacter sp. H5]|uniref:protoporphyrinogen oxidase n=1 Tax=Arthrobacter sp. H5 TaxID=1267973 RepID=UPI00048089CC|nr:protoporphyrinogen oxidase [Arthrobacter sp. H5]